MSLQPLFDRLNALDTCPYVVLRNWDGLPDQAHLGSHSDLDLLVQDYAVAEAMLLALDAVKCHSEPWRVQYRLPVGDSFQLIDLRSVGDGYYADKEAEAVLDCRQQHANGFYVPCPEEHFSTLLYHATTHKKWFSKGYNQWGRITSVVERVEINRVVKTQRSKVRASIDVSECAQNEARALFLLGGDRHFPNMLWRGDPDPWYWDMDMGNPPQIHMEYAGQPLTKENLPDDWEVQVQEIVAHLAAKRLVHRDIMPANVHVKRGVLMLIDHGWCVPLGKEDDYVPPDLGGKWRKPGGWDDEYSLRKTVETVLEK